MINWDAPSRLDRAEEHRTSPDWILDRWNSETTAMIVLDDRGAFATAEGGIRLRLHETSETFDPQRHFFLGLVDGVAYFATESTIEGDAHTVREVGQHLDDNERELATMAAALTHWHRAEPRCPRCGRVTEVRNGGSVRHCVHDQRDLFPRTDPAIIVAVTDPQDRLLLAGQVVWGPRRVSVLAGFNEAGESLEQTVHREVAEEVGIRLGEVRYFGSQPWPMPRSLMLGFNAEAISAEITVDGVEIAHADWYSRERVRELTATGELALPGASSIAHRLIDAWLSGDR